MDEIFACVVSKSLYSRGMHSSESRCKDFWRSMPFITSGIYTSYQRRQTWSIFQYLYKCSSSLIRLTADFAIATERAHFLIKKLKLFTRILFLNEMRNQPKTKTSE